MLNYKLCGIILVSCLIIYIISRRWKDLDKKYFHVSIRIWYCIIAFIMLILSTHGAIYWINSSLENFTIFVKIYVWIIQCIIFSGIFCLISYLRKKILKLPMYLWIGIVLASYFVYRANITVTELKSINIVFN